MIPSYLLFALVDEIPCSAVHCQSGKPNPTCAAIDRGPCIVPDLLVVELSKALRRVFLSLHEIIGYRSGEVNVLVSRCAYLAFVEGVCCR